VSDSHVGLGALINLDRQCAFHGCGSRSCRIHAHRYGALGPCGSWVSRITGCRTEWACRWPKRLGDIGRRPARRLAVRRIRPRRWKQKGRWSRVWSRPANRFGWAFSHALVVALVQAPTCASRPPVAGGVDEPCAIGRTHQAPCVPVLGADQSATAGPMNHQPGHSRQRRRQ
jgi:hypothetical protein